MAGRLWPHGQAEGRTLGTNKGFEGSPPLPLLLSFASLTIHRTDGCHDSFAMAQPRLNDAAIALYCSFAEANVRFGIFGGYAITALGGPRESKDVDCLASLTKAQAISILDGKNGFTVIPQTRQDYVAFLWTPPGDKNRAVLVEIFCESFPGKSLPAPVRVDVTARTPWPMY